MRTVAGASSVSAGEGGGAEAFFLTGGGTAGDLGGRRGPRGRRLLPGWGRRRRRGLDLGERDVGEGGGGLDRGGRGHDRLVRPQPSEPGAEAILQILDERARGLVAVVGLLGQGLAEHLVPLLGHEAVHLQVRGFDGVDVHQLVEDRGHVVPRERLLPGEHLEAAHSQREDVAPPVELVPHGLLGRHVGGGAEEGAGLRHLRIHQLRDPKVGHLDSILVEEDQVRGLDVAVDHTLAVGVVHGGGDLAGQPDHLLRLEAHALLDQGGEGLALHKLHGQVRDPSLLADVEEGDDVGMGERARDSGLVVEPLDERFVLGALARDVQADGLDREGALDQGVEGFVDGPHGPEADAFLDLVAADALGHLLG